MSNATVDLVNTELSSWAKTAIDVYGAKDVYVFGSLIYKDGDQFGDRSDIDLVVVMPSLGDAAERHRWLEQFGKHKDHLEVTLMRALHRSGDEPSVSVVVVTELEIEFDIHKDGHRDFFTQNTFRDLSSGALLKGMPAAGKRNPGRFISGSLAFTQKLRNEYFAVSANLRPLLQPYHGPDPLPKRMMRAAAMAAVATNQNGEPGAEHDVQEGLDALTNRLYHIREKDPIYNDLQNLISVRRGARGAAKDIDPSRQLLLSEIIYDIAIPTPAKDGSQSSEDSNAPAEEYGKGETGADKSKIIGGSDNKTIMPFGSSTTFFAERFASAFPGVRSTMWYDKSSDIELRLSRLLCDPLTFSNGTPIWWWRGGNLQIEIFKKIGPSEFLMNYEELKISKIAAVPGNVYYRSFVYVYCDAMDPTGLYQNYLQSGPEMESSTKYDYEEYGLVDGDIKIRREEYDDGYAEIAGRIADVKSRSELRIRYITPYNFIIAAHESPINNPSFDSFLESNLDKALKSSDISIVENIRKRVESLPARTVYRE